MNAKSKFAYIALLSLMLFISGSSAGINNVALLDNLSQSQTSETLIKLGFEPLFKYCFSEDVKKHYIIPGSQDPAAGTPLKVGEQVKVSVSLGQFPNVIGKSKDEAKYIFGEYNISINLIPGHNSSYLTGYIYDQFPIEAGCIYPNLSINLFENLPVNVVIRSPLMNQFVHSTVLVSAIVTPPLISNEEYFWIAVRPYNSMKDWWPQSNGPIEPINGHLEGYAHLSGNEDDKFEIAILLLDNSTNQEFTAYSANSSKLNYWQSISNYYFGNGGQISKERIEKSKVASVTVTLGKSN